MANFFPFNTGRDKDTQFSSSNVKNMFYEAGQFGPYGAKLVMRPGVKAFNALDLAATPRGAAAMDDILYVVAGTSLFSITAGGVLTNQTTVSGVSIGGSDRVSMTVIDTNTAAQLVIVNGSNKYVYTIAGGLITVTDGDDLPANTVTSLSGRAISESIGTDKWIGSDINDATLYTSTSFLQAIKTPGPIIKVFAHQGQMYAFKAGNLESYYDAGLDIFPFASNNLDIPFGLNANGVETVLPIKQSLLFLGDDFQVYTMNTNSPSPVSSPAITRDIRGEDLATTNAYALSYELDSHRFYILRLPTQTLVLDLSTGLWSEWSIDISTCTNVFGKWMVTTAAGKVAELDPDEYEDIGSTPIQWECNPLTLFSKGPKFSIRRIDLEMLKGQTPNNAAEGTVLLAVSYDNGITYPGEFQQTTGVGASGEREKEVSWWRPIGRLRNNNRVDFRLSGSTAMKTEIYGLSVHFQSGRGIQL